MSKSIGQPVIVENKPGGSGAVAVHALLGAAPDGRTLLVGSQNVLTEVPLVLKLSFDPQKDLKPVAEVARSSLVMVAYRGLKADSLAQVIAHAKANPGKMSYASYSPGTVSHYAGLVLNRAAAIDLVHVPYKGSPLALQDVLGGQLPLMFDGMATSLPLIRAGKLRALCTTGREKFVLLPDYPTCAAAVPGLVALNWWGVMVPAGTPKAVVDKFQADMVKVMRDDVVKSKFADLGVEAVYGNSAQFAAFIRQETDKYAKLIKEAGIKGN